MAPGIAYYLARLSCEMLNVSRKQDRFETFEVTKSDDSGLDGTTISKPPSTGSLGSIPLDIMYELLMSFDFKSVTRLRLLNSCYRVLVDSFPAYRILKNHARQTLRVMCRTKVDSQWSVGQIFTEMCYRHCRTCTDFGPYIFLPTCSRCCYNCLRSRDEYELAYLSNVKAIFALPEDEIKHLVALDNIPIPWTFFSLKEAMWYDVESCPRPQLVSVRRGYELSMKIYGSKYRLKKAVEKCNLEWRKEWSEHFPCYTVDGNVTLDVVNYWSAKRLSFGPGMKGHNFCYTVNGRLIEEAPQPCELVSMKRTILDKYEPQHARLLGSTFFPFWNVHTQTAEPGMYCSACGYLWHVIPNFRREDLHRFRRAYLSTEIQRHFEQCKATQKGYRQRDWPSGSKSRRPETYGYTSPDFQITAEGEITKVPRRKPQGKRTSGQAHQA